VLFRSGLLTALALHALWSADCVIYDALVSDDILALANPAAALEFAGKRGGKPSVDQPDITRRMIELAGRGQRVLRLKGGDPFVFGRGGEEALALAAHRVPFRFVPGITAAIGGLAYAGIPMTHRTTNSAVTFITGHEAGGGMPESLNWQAIASGAETLILYMALGRLGAIAARLIEGGVSADTPTALVTWATTPKQKIVETTLVLAATDAAQAGIEAPCIVVVGNGVLLRKALDPAASIDARAEAAEQLAAHWRQVDS